MARPEVDIRITGNARGLDRAVGQARGSLTRLGRDLSGLQRLASRALSFAGLGGGASVAGLVALAKQAADTADEFAKMSQRTGVAVEDLSRLGYTVSLSGATLTDLENGLRNLSRTMDDASSGTGAVAERYSDLGIAVADSAGNLRAPLDVLRDLADRFAATEDGAQKTAIAAELLGRSGTALIPTLNLGADGLKRMADESDRFGKTISTELARRSEEFNDTLTRLQALAGGVGQELGLSLVPALNALAVSFLEAATEQRDLTDENNLQTWAEGGAKSVAFLVDVLDGFWRVPRIIGIGIGAYAAMGAQALQGNFAAARTIYNELSADVERILQEQQFSARLARNLAPDVQQAATNVEARRRLEQRLNDELIKLNEVRSRAAKKSNEEELKGVERLKAALQSAWQESINGARAARAEAASLLDQAADAAQSGVDKAAQRRMRGMSDEERDAEAFSRSRELQGEARSLADRAIIATYDGDLRAAEALAAQAAKAAERAEAYVDNIADDDVAARLFEELGQIRADALSAQARVKEEEAKALTEVAAAQEQQIKSAEERIVALKKALEEPVTLDAEIEQAVSKIAQIQAQLDALPDSKTITINTVSNGVSGLSNLQVERPDGAWVDAGAGFARGGYTGPGGKYEPAGIVHRGEFVLPQEIVRRPGVIAHLSRLLATGKLPGYADGGLVSRLDPGRISARGGAGGSSSTPLVLDLGALGRFETAAATDVADQLARAVHRAALQRGRRKS